MANLSIWVLLPPLLGFIILGLLGRIMPRGAILTIAWGAVGVAFLFALSNFFSLNSTPVAQRVSDQPIYQWVLSGNLTISFGVYYDALTAVMLLIITGVGLLIHIYSAGYMDEDPGFWRFFTYMNFFIFAMVLLVVADNFHFLLIGWGLVGLASFLLIGFWFQRRAPVAAARKAFVVNVIGDFGLMLAIFLMFGQFGSLNYQDVLVGKIGSLPAGSGMALAICLLLFVACAAKSAQLPLYMWLPDAMEGPTPVSALIHAATMVTAGVYLVARAHPLFELSPASLTTIAIIGGATALFAATIALTQLDIKRVLAYSTISQLGYMFMGEGVHNYTSGIFHLTTHAYFKALLFLGAGAVIHALLGEQDMRKMGGLKQRMPITYWTFLIGALAISGIFPFAGFWSKDSILGAVLQEAQSNPAYYVLWGVGLLTAGLTAFYMFRLFYGIFFGDYRGASAVPVSHDEEANGDDNGHGHGAPSNVYDVYEVPAIMYVPLVILAILSVVGGLVGSFALFGLKWAPLPGLLDPVLGTPHELSIGLDWLSTGLSLVAALIGIYIAWRRYGKGFQYKQSSNPFYQLSLNKYYVDEALDVVLIKPTLALARFLNRAIEGFTLDGGSRGIAAVLRGTSSGLRRLQTGYMRNYALAIFVGVLLIILFYVFQAVRG